MTRPIESCNLGIIVETWARSAKLFTESDALETLSKSRVESVFGHPLH